MGRPRLAVASLMGLVAVIALGSERVPIPVPVEALAARQIRVGNFVQISRMALALCFALIGGYLGRAFNERRRGLTGQGPPVTS